jgi:TIR domain
MPRIEKTVFISYRRCNVSWALAIFQNLRHNDFDVFFDFKGIASGDFERVIMENIRVRAHFLVLLAPSALKQRSEPEDWLRKEIEEAMRLERNIVPLLLDGFDFSAPENSGQLTGPLAKLKKYNALRVHGDYFDEAMDRLRDTYLNIPLKAVLHPASDVANQVARIMQAAANNAPVVSTTQLTTETKLENMKWLDGSWLTGTRFASLQAKPAPELGLALTKPAPAAGPEQAAAEVFPTYIKRPDRPWLKPEPFPFDLAKLTASADPAPAKASPAAPAKLPLPLSELPETNSLSKYARLFNLEGPLKMPAAGPEAAQTKPAAGARLWIPKSLPESNAPSGPRLNLGARGSYFAGDQAFNPEPILKKTDPKTTAKNPATESFFTNGNWWNRPPKLGSFYTGPLPDVEPPAANPAAEAKKQQFYIDLLKDWPSLPESSETGLLNLTRTPKQQPAKGKKASAKAKPGGN